MDEPVLDYLTTDRFSALGDVPVLVAEAATWAAPDAPARSVIIGIDRDGAMPAIDPEPFDVLLTSASDAPAPWVSCKQIDAEIERLTGAIRAWPVAATMLCRVLRLGEGLSFEARLELESLAYSTLLGGGEFAHWLSARPAQAQNVSASPLLQIERDGDHVTLTLNDPGSQNAMTANMRDALFAALATVLDDPTWPTVTLQGAGRCFSTGGALGEFGSAVDLAEAHNVRSVRSVAGLLDRLGERASVHIHGACIGSGLEIAATAAHRTAAPDSWFQLPELRMGLIPGAGGTASVTQRIGRHRTGWLVLSGKRINAAKALEWGLIDAIA